jgi:hypothetical protein
MRPFFEPLFQLLLSVPLVLSVQPLFYHLHERICNNCYMAAESSATVENTFDKQSVSAYRELVERFPANYFVPTGILDLPLIGKLLLGQEH